MSNALNKEKTKSFGELKAEETIDSFCEKLNQSQFTNLSFYLNKNFYVDDEFMQPDIILLNNSKIYVIEIKCWKEATLFINPESKFYHNMKKINQNLNTESEEEEAPIIEVLNISTTNEQLIINKYNNPIEQARNYSLKLRELIKSETSKKKFQIKNLIVFVNPNNHNTVFTYINNQDEYIELDMKNEFFDLDKFTTICSIDNFNTWLSKNINKDDESLDCKG